MIPDNTTRIPVNRNLLARFFSKVYICDDMWFNGTPCWLWSGAKHTQHGYAFIKINRVMQYGHRVTIRMFVQAIPKGAQTDHLCRIKNCVNPVHLEVVTPQINTLRGVSPSALNAKKTHCKRGHPFTPENTYIYTKGSRRSCRICMNGHAVKYQMLRLL